MAFARPSTAATARPAPTECMTAAVSTATFPPSREGCFPSGPARQCIASQERWLNGRWERRRRRKEAGGRAVFHPENTLGDFLEAPKSELTTNSRKEKCGRRSKPKVDVPACRKGKSISPQKTSVAAFVPSHRRRPPRRRDVKISPNVVTL